MATVSKPYTFTSGTTADATEVNADFDTLYTLVNGNIDNANIKSAAAIDSSKLAEIPLTKLGDFAASITEFGTILAAGDTASPASVTNGLSELLVLRDRLAAVRGYNTEVYYMNTGPTKTAAIWTEPRIAGPNLLPNPGFELHSSSTATDAPDGWSLVGTPSNCDIASPAYPTAGLEKKHLNITSNGSTEGIQATVSGLKKSTKYLIGAQYARVSGELNIVTSGAVSGANYGDLALTDFSTTGIRIYQGIIQTDTTPSDITVKFYATATGAEFNLINVWMYELTDTFPFALPAIPMQTADYTTTDDLIAGGGAATWTTLSDLSLSQYVPYTGYRFTYEATLCFRGPAIAGSVRKYQYAFRIQQNIDAGGATTVEGPYSWIANQQTNNEFIGGTVTLRYVIENPTPGSTYAFTVDAFVENDGSDEAATMTMNPTIGGGTAVAVSRSRLIVEKL